MRIDKCKKQKTENKTFLGELSYIKCFRVSSSFLSFNLAKYDQNTTQTKKMAIFETKLLCMSSNF